MAERKTRTYFLTRVVFQRALAFIYLNGFFIIVNQYVPLLGEHGILPIPIFLKHVSFLQAPGLFTLYFSDIFASCLAWCGFIVSVFALTGLSERFGAWVSAATWFVLWFLYLTFVNAGQTFYGFGWETLLLETGFLAIFLGSRDMKPPVVVVWLLRWILFRLMFGAGMIKIHADPCWRDLTCMMYHYETQPVPNPLSWFAHWLPPLFHKIEVAVTHVVELILPWGYFIPGILGWVTGISAVIFQLMLIFSGNLSWLNYISIVLCISCFDDRFFRKFIPSKTPDPPAMSIRRKVVLGALCVMIGVLSVRPALNLFAKNQLMNASFEPLHLVNTYGAFGGVTKIRREVIIEGTHGSVPSNDAVWKEYEFKCKPGDVSRAPCLMSPYQFRLDWQIWFAAMGPATRYPWFFNLISKLLQDDKRILALLDENPFENDPPQFIRASLYEYHFTTQEERRATGNWWRRKYVGEYLPPVSLNHRGFRQLLKKQGWLM